MFNNGAGFFNTAIGDSALFHNTGGGNNTAVGVGALFNNGGGGNNVAIGVSALHNNTSPDGNTAVGTGALLSNTTGGTPGGSGTTTVGPNTAVGDGALSNNTTGGANTAVGYLALSSITNNNWSTAVGFQALASSFSDSNDAFGYGALKSDTTGTSNTAIGDLALYNNTSGSTNVALGLGAGFLQNTGSGNIYIGFGMNGVAGENNSCYIGSVFGAISSSGTAVYINSSGKVGTVPSSRRFKEELRPMDNTSEAIYALKPVAFRYKKEIDPAGAAQLGLVAEDVEKVNPDLIVRDNKGSAYGVRYDQVNAMLLNEFLKEHHTVQEQGAAIAELKKKIAALTSTVEEEAAQLQKIRAELGMRKATLRMALNNQ